MNGQFIYIFDNGKLLGKILRKLERQNMAIAGLCVISGLLLAVACLENERIEALEERLACDESVE